MPPKREQKVKKVEVPVENEKKVAGISEVEKVFLEQKLADSNRKVARLKLVVEEYESRNEELQKAYEKLDEDRADIIAYLRRTVKRKNDENVELKDNVKDLEELRVKEMSQLKTSMAQLEKRFNFMKDQLTAENKLLAGKYNTMDEFKATRDDLMKKYADLEHAFKELEMQHKRTIYDSDKKFVIGKDKLKKEMEARLLKLAQDFQNASELRIAASTHRAIRENIAINYEINNILTSQSKLSKQNEIFREKDKSAQIAKELAEEERDRAIEKNIVLIKVVSKLKSAYNDILKEKVLFDKNSFDFATLEEKVCKITNKNEKQAYKIRLLEQRLHARMCDESKYTAGIFKAIAECKRLKDIIREAAIVIQATLNLDKIASFGAREETVDQKELLQKSLHILNEFRDIQKVDSIETIASFGQMYEQGDLGFIPQMSVAKKKTPLTDEMIKIITEASSGSSDSFIESVGSIKTIPSLDILPPLDTKLEREKSSSGESINNIETSGISLNLQKEQSETGDMNNKLDQSLIEVSSIKDLLNSQVQDDNHFATESKKFYKKESHDEREIDKDNMTNSNKETDERNYFESKILSNILFEDKDMGADKIDESTQKINRQSEDELYAAKKG